MKMKAQTPVLEKVPHRYTWGSSWKFENIYYACDRELSDRVPKVNEAKKIRLHLETHPDGEVLRMHEMPNLESALWNLIIPFRSKKCKAWVEIVEWAE